MGLEPSSCTWSTIEYFCNGAPATPVNPRGPLSLCLPCQVACLPPLLLPVHARSALVGIPCRCCSNPHLVLVFSSVSTVVHLRPPLSACPGPASLPALQGNKTSRAANPKTDPSDKGVCFHPLLFPLLSDPRKQKHRVLTTTSRSHNLPRASIFDHVAVPFGYSLVWLLLATPSQDSPHLRR